MNGDVIVHRIVRNDTNEKVLYTKGDANAAEDMNPVPYNMVIGRVERAIPHLGNVIALYTSRQGKVCVLGFLLAGMLLVWVSGRVSPDRKERLEKEQLLQEALVREGLITPKTPKKKAIVQKETDGGGGLARKYRFFMAAASVLLVLLVVVIGLICRVLYRYTVEKDTYEEARAAICGSDNRGGPCCGRRRRKQQCRGGQCLSGAGGF